MNPRPGLTVRIGLCETLWELRDTLNEIHDELVAEDEVNPDVRVEDVVDLANLPTFGGEAPRNTEEVYSWDRSQILIHNGSWSVRERDEEPTHTEIIEAGGLAGAETTVERPHLTITGLINRLTALRAKHGNLPVRMIMPIDPDNALWALAQVDGVHAGFADENLGLTEIRDAHDQNAESQTYGEEPIWKDADLEIVLTGTIHEATLANLKTQWKRR